MDICYICLDEISTSHDEFLSCCGHVLHVSCAYGWFLEINKTEKSKALEFSCTICRETYSEIEMKKIELFKGSGNANSISFERATRPAMLRLFLDRLEKAFSSKNRDEVLLLRAKWKPELTFIEQRIVFEHILDSGHSDAYLLFTTDDLRQYDDYSLLRFSYRNNLYNACLILYMRCFYTLPEEEVVEIGRFLVDRGNKGCPFGIKDLGETLTENFYAKNRGGFYIASVLMSEFPERKEFIHVKLFLPSAIDRSMTSLPMIFQSHSDPRVFYYKEAVQYCIEQRNYSKLAHILEFLPKKGNYSMLSSGEFKRLIMAMDEKWKMARCIAKSYRYSRGFSPVVNTVWSLSFQLKVAISMVLQRN